MSDISPPESNFVLVLCYNVFVMNLLFTFVGCILVQELLASVGTEGAMESAVGSLCVGAL